MIENIDRTAGRAVADRLLELVSQDRIDELSAELGELISRHAPRRRLLRPVLTSLAAMAAELVTDSAGPVDERYAFTVDVRDETDDAVELDELRPSLRAMLRAVLALLSEHPEDAGFQLDLVIGDPDPLGRMDAVVHALLWVHGLRDPGHRSAAGFAS
jgi:hypothetical protein